MRNVRRSNRLLPPREGVMLACSSLICDGITPLAVFCFKAALSSLC